MEKKYLLHSYSWLPDGQIKVCFESTSFFHDSGGRVSEIISAQEFERRFKIVPKRSSESLK